MAAAGMTVSICCTAMTFWIFLAERHPPASPVTAIRTANPIIPCTILYIMLLIFFG